MQVWVVVLCRVPHQPRSPRVALPEAARRLVLPHMFLPDLHPSFQPLERGPILGLPLLGRRWLRPHALCLPPEGLVSLVIVACGRQSCNLQASSRWKKYTKSRTTFGQLGFCWMLAAHTCPRLCGEARCPKFSWLFSAAFHSKAAFVDFCAEMFAGSVDMIQCLVRVCICVHPRGDFCSLFQECRDGRCGLRKLMNGAAERKLDAKHFEEGLIRFGWTGRWWH